MLERGDKLAIYMEGALKDASGKMGFGVLRYSPNPVVAVIDSTFAGNNVQQVIETPRSAPVVGCVAEAAALGAEVFVLGIAPPGGLIPGDWWPVIDEALAAGMSVVNGLHDLIGPRAKELRPGQWVWDIRIEPPGLGVGSAAARELPNRRVLMIGTDMACGKMTAGLEIHREAKSLGMRSEFVATGQIGMTIMGSGVPLDAVRLDFACGAIEREVMRVRDAELIIVEGQGALIHPGSTATLPLLRGSCPTHLVLCHRARATSLQRVQWVRIPNLRDYARLYEDLACAIRTFPRPVTTGICLNTSGLGEQEAREEIGRVSNEAGVPAADPVRFGANEIVNALLA